MIKAQPSAYNHIRAWHVLTGSHPYYWQKLQVRASEDGAPIDAIFYDTGNNRWVTIKECKSQHTIDRVENFLKAEK